MEKPPLSKRHKIFYGYWIVAAAFFCLFITSGCGFYAFSLFVKPLQTDFNWGRGEIMAAFTIFYLMMGIASPFTGWMVDSHGVRKVISMGAAMTGLGFVFLSFMNNLWHFYVGYAVIGTGIAAIGFVPASTVVSNWFEKRRGLAIGIMATGVGIGGLALAPLVGGYLIPNFGWRASYFALALLTWVLIIPLALFVIKIKPADMGLYPDGIETPETIAPTEALHLASEGLSLRMALATPAFWLIATSYMLSHFSHVGAVQSQVPYLDDIGFSVAMAAAALGGVGLASAVAKFGFGWLCDWIPAKYAFCIGLVLQAVSIIILMSIEPATPLALIWLYAILMGLGAGSWLPTMSMLTSTNFGLASYSAIFGTASFFRALGSAIGPLVAGYMYDTMNTYHWAFVTCAALYLIAIPSILLVRRPKSL